MGHKKVTGLVSREDALRDFMNAWKLSPESLVQELVPLTESIGRVVAQDLTSCNTIPVVRASAMDGIAVRSSEFADGVPDTSNWRMGRDFVRADTGDDFPDEFDATIAIEDVTIAEDGTLTIEPDVEVSPGANVRPAGSQLKAGYLF